MKGNLWMALVFAVGSVILSVPLYAHHGSAAFDVSKRVTLTGTVSKWVWANPHCLLLFDVQGENGKIVHWSGEVAAPINMMYSGWRQNSFKPGDKVTVTLAPGKSGRPVGGILKVTLPNGKTLTGGLPTPKEGYSKGRSADR